MYEAFSLENGEYSDACKVCAKTLFYQTTMHGGSSSKNPFLSISLWKYWNDFLGDLVL